MFAQKLTLTLHTGTIASPVPIAWLDQFFLRSFTGSGAFDHTLPTADGQLEAAFDVDPAQLQSAFETWLRGRKLVSSETTLTVEFASRKCGTRRSGA